MRNERKGDKVGSEKAERFIGNPEVGFETNGRVEEV